MDRWIDPSWSDVLAPHTETVQAILRTCEPDTLPRREDVFHALAVPREQVRLVIVGQDPYPTPGHAHGLAFSVPTGVTPLPRSLANIFTELGTDLGVRRTRGDLSDWVAQGVLLLNRVLTVRAGQPGSHRGRGWEEFTEALLRSITPTVAILWGNDAQRARPLLPGAAIIASAHPSPLSAHRGFLGSRPFSKADAALAAAGQRAIAWGDADTPSA